MNYAFPIENYNYKFDRAPILLHPVFYEDAQFFASHVSFCRTTSLSSHNER